MIIAGPVFDAQAEARRIVDEARREAEAIREAARREGFAAGRQEGLAALTEDSIRLGLERARAATAAEQELRRLAVKIAEKILRRQLSLTPEAVAGLVGEVLAATRSRQTLSVHVHPDDAPLLDGLPRDRVVVVPDPLLERGDCVVETPHGAVDGRIASQLAAIERALVG